MLDEIIMEMVHESELQSQWTQIEKIFPELVTFTLRSYFQFLKFITVIKFLSSKTKQI